MAAFRPQGQPPVVAQGGHGGPPLQSARGGVTVHDDDPAYTWSYFVLDTFLTGIMISVFIFE